MFLIINFRHVLCTSKLQGSCICRRGVTITRSSFIGELSWSRTTFDLRESTVVHFLSLLDHLHYVILLRSHISLIRLSLSDILVRNSGKIIRLTLCLWVIFPPVWIAASIGVSFSWILSWRSASLTSQFLASLTGSWWNNHLLKVTWILLSCKTLHRWILLVRLTRWLSRDVIFQSNLALQTDIKALVIQRWVMSILPVDWIHGIESVLDLFILLAAHILWLSSLSCCSTDISWKLQVEVNAWSKLVHINCVFGRLIYIGGSCNKSVITWAGSQCWSHGSSKLS